MFFKNELQCCSDSRYSRYKSTNAQQGNIIENFLNGVNNTPFKIEYNRNTIQGVSKKLNKSEMTIMTIMITITIITN